MMAVYNKCKKLKLKKDDCIVKICKLRREIDQDN